jgi:hypothetical protein
MPEGGGLKKQMPRLGCSALEEEEEEVEGGGEEEEEESCSSYCREFVAFKSMLPLFYS